MILKQESSSFKNSFYWEMNFKKKKQQNLKTIFAFLIKKELFCYPFLGHVPVYVCVCVCVFINCSYEPCLRPHTHPLSLWTTRLMSWKGR